MPTDDGYRLEGFTFEALGCNTIARPARLRDSGLTNYKPTGPEFKKRSRLWGLGDCAPPWKASRRRFPG